MRKGNMTILASILAIILVAVGVGAGSMAYFSDEARSEDSIFTAGTMEVQVGTVVTGNPTIYDNLEPGEPLTGSMTVTNIGSLDGDLWGRTMYTSTVLGPQSQDLANMLITTSLSIDGSPIWEPAGGIALSAYGNGAWQYFGRLNSGDPVIFSSIGVFSTNAGNGYQETSTTVWFEVMLTQVGIAP